MCGQLHSNLICSQNVCIALVSQISVSFGQLEYKNLVWIVVDPIIYSYSFVFVFTHLLTEI